MKILFSNSSPKIPKSGIFGPKYRRFFFREVLQIDKFEDADFKYYNSFLKFQPKNSQIRHFGPKARDFDFFAKFFNLTNSKLLISNMTKVFFKILVQKYQNRVFLFKNTQIRPFWFQFQTFSLFHDILQLDKFEGADFKYGNIAFKFQPKNTQIRHFWSRIQAFLFFREILQIDKFEGADIKYDYSFFKFQPKNTQIRHFWSQILLFCFLTKFCNQANSKVLIANMTIVFLNSSPKITK